MKQDCTKCGRTLDPLDRADAIGWNVEMKRGVPQWYICPNCQTPEQNAEAEVHAATLEYGRDTFGRIVGRVKGT